jgi:hypothetical protein
LNCTSIRNIEGSNMYFGSSPNAICSDLIQTLLASAAKKEANSGPRVLSRKGGPQPAAGTGDENRSGRLGFHGVAAFQLIAMMACRGCRPTITDTTARMNQPLQSLCDVTHQRSCFTALAPQPAPG